MDGTMAPRQTPRQKKKVRWTDEEELYVYDHTLNTRYLDFNPCTLVLTVCVPLMIGMLSAAWIFVGK